MHPENYNLRIQNGRQSALFLSLVFLFMFFNTPTTTPSALSDDDDDAADDNDDANDDNAFLFCSM